MSAPPFFPLPTSRSTAFSVLICLRSILGTVLALSLAMTPALSARAASRDKVCGATCRFGLQRHSSSPFSQVHAGADIGYRGLSDIRADEAPQSCRARIWAPWLRGVGRAGGSGQNRDHGRPCGQSSYVSHCMRKGAPTKSRGQPNSGSRSGTGLRHALAAPAALVPHPHHVPDHDGNFFLVSVSKVPRRLSQCD
jgi:hypothetical protein